MPDGTQLVDWDDISETRRLESLYRYGVLDTAPEESFDRITRLARGVLRTDIVAVSLVDRDRVWFKSRQGTDMCSADRDVAFCSHAIHSAEPLIVPDMLEDARFANNPLVANAPYLRFYLGVPLRTCDGHSIGTLCALDTVPRVPTADQIAVMQDLSKLVMDELELRQLATIDELTGAQTRRAFMVHGDQAISRSERYNHPLSLITFDIDHFKLVNDTHGHAAGDETLRFVAGCCRAELRSFDVFGRLGGEEFAVLVPEQGATRASAIAERLRKRIAATVVRLRTGPLRVTASFGVAEHMRHGSVADLLAEADAALYLAKRSGRNQTVTAPPVRIEQGCYGDLRPVMRF